MSLTIRGYAQTLNTQTAVQKAQKKQQDAMSKIASGSAINSGKDNPAGLLISEMLRSQLSGYQRALSNTMETNNMLSVAEGGLSGVNSMLQDMRGLAISALNTGVRGGMQTAADQMQLNSALTSINQVVSTTNYAGQNLLDGAKDFTFDTSDSAGMIDAGGTNISNISGSIPNQISVSYDGQQSSQAEKAFVEADFGGSALSTDQEFTITGNDGSRTFSFAAGTGVADMAEQINSMSDSTGVNAYAIRDTGTGETSIRLVSSEYGSDASVRVDQAAGDGFAAAGSTAMDRGQDATVTVNSQKVTGDGLNASYSAGGVSGNVALTESVAQGGYDQDTLVDASAAQNSALTNIKGGMQLQLGEGAGDQNRETVSLGNFSPGRLGQVEYDGKTYSLNDLYGGGAASLQNNPELALQIIDQAIDDVSSGRANIGAYQANTLDSNASNLATALENVTRTESAIRDADLAMAIAEMTSANVQEEAGLRMLQTQNMNSYNVLQLLGLGGGMR